MAEPFQLLLHDGHGGSRDIAPFVREYVETHCQDLGRVLLMPTIDEVAAVAGYRHPVTMLNAANRNGVYGRDGFFSAVMGAPVRRIEGYVLASPVDESDEDSDAQISLPDGVRKIDALAGELIMEDSDGAEALAHAILARLGVQIKQPE